MPKLKTKKTLLKRVRITSRGKIVKKHTQIGHLKSKWDSSKHSRNSRRGIQLNKGHRKLFKKLLAKAGNRIR
jgi:ribosomal protein L35